MSLIATSLSATEVWSRLLERAKQTLTEAVYRTWLEPTEALSLEEKASDAANGLPPKLIVTTPDQFSADWNDSKFADMMASYAPVALGHPITVVFRVSEERKTRPQMDLFVAPPPEEVAAAKRQAGAIKASLTPRYTFGQFVAGKSNELAFAAANAVALSPGKQYNPLFIYGATGLGKTHLMQAIAHDVLDRHPNTRISVVATEQFVNEMVTAIQTRTNGDFRRKYRETDMLLVDDVHFLKGKEGTQEEFFHTFNALHESMKQIVIASDRPPKELAEIEDRLRSRFEWGLIADIQPPDLETKVAILQKKAEQEKVTLPTDVALYIASNIRSNVRELEGALIRLVAHSSLIGAEITLPYTQQVLKNFIDSQARKVTIESIQKAVAEQFGLRLVEIKAKNNSRAIVYPRQIAMYLAKHLTEASLPEIGRQFGGKHHTTVLHSVEKIDEVRKNDKDLNRLLNKLTEQLGG
jgi:chromosomal replication initiator protein